MGNFCDIPNYKHLFSVKVNKTLSEYNFDEIVLDSPEKIISFLKANNKDVYIHLSLGPYFNNFQASEIAKYLKRCRFYSKIDLDIGMYVALGCKLNDQGAISLIDSLSEFTEILILHIKFYVNYNLTNKTADKIANLLNKNNCNNLTSFFLNFKHTKIDNNGFDKICKALVYKKKLRCLHIEIMNNNLNNEGLESLGMLIENNENIKEINFCLENNNITNVQQFARILKEKRNSVEIVNIELPNNDIIDSELFQHPDFENFRFTIKF